MWNCTVTNTVLQLDCASRARRKGGELPLDRDQSVCSRYPGELSGASPLQARAGPGSRKASDLLNRRDHALRRRGIPWPSSPAHRSAPSRPLQPVSLHHRQLRLLAIGAAGIFPSCLSASPWAAVGCHRNTKGFGRSARSACRIGAARCRHRISLRHRAIPGRHPSCADDRILRDGEGRRGAAEAAPQAWPLVGDDISENSLSCNHAAIACITRITVAARNGSGLAGALAMPRR
jgi:hypothetical protein